MVRHQSSKVGVLVAGLAGLGILAGCSGNTYGTGVTSEQQLLNDVSGLFTLGAPGRKSTRIDYTSRPKLVKAPADGSLPAPAEKDDSQDAYFPQDPEADRQARLKEIDAANSDPSNLGAKRAAPGSYNPQTAPKPKQVQHYDHDLSAEEYRALSINGQKSAVPGLQKSTAPLKQASNVNT